MQSERLRGQRGVAMAEFALIMPFLALLTFATVDLGRVYTLQHRLANAAREGAIFAQFYPGQVSSTGTCADPNNIVYHALGEDSGTTRGFTVTITNVTTGTAITGPCVTSGITPGTKLKVTVAGTFTPLTFFARQFVGSPATIRRSAQVVVQG
jgi:Flp pilus assembly protein TadG